MVKLEGSVLNIVFRNAENGFTVFLLQCGRDKVTCVGSVPPFNPGERLEVSGEWTEHRDYGKQLRVEQCEVRPITTLSGIERYLGSGIIRGVGPATAKLIVRRFGKDTLDILDTDPYRLTEVTGIGNKKAAMIAESYHAQRMTRMAMVFLETYGISPALAARIVKVLGDETEKLVRQDPYVLSEKIEGIGFKTADRIAFSLGMEKESEHRILCGICYVLEEAVYQEGHTYLPLEELSRRARRVLEVDESMIGNAVRRQLMDGNLVLRRVGEESRCYLPASDLAEAESARMLQILRKTHRPLTGANPEQEAKRFEKKSGMTLSRAQIEALEKLAEEGIVVITGGPGTGKTTCINCVLQLLKTAGKVLLCAPTGRAAKRMTEATGWEAKTIHRLLEYNGEEERFSKDEDNPLDCAALVVDEMSMVDIFLLRALLKALRPGTRLVMVGDADQLPSVGAGNVLKDLIASGQMPVVRLNQIFRQADISMIPTNAQRINSGEYPILNRRGSDCFIERVGDPRAAAETVKVLCGTRLPAYLGVKGLSAIQVMSPMKKGEAGVWELNRALQEALNPPEAGKAEMIWGDMLFRAGDKVMQVRNNYELPWEKDGEEGEGAFNGDIGIVEEVNRAENSLLVRFDDDRLAHYAEEDLNDLELGYCITVHKSQGSEFEAVVLALTGGPPMLFSRNLLYTAVTRAKKLLVIVGTDEVVRRMVDNNHIARRYSALAERLQGQAEWEDGNA